MTTTTILKSRYLTAGFAPELVRQIALTYSGGSLRRLRSAWQNLRRLQFLGLPARGSRSKRQRDGDEKDIRLRQVSRADWQARPGGAENGARLQILLCEQVRHMPLSLTPRLRQLLLLFSSSPARRSRDCCGGYHADAAQRRRRLARPCRRIAGAAIQATGTRR